MEECQAVVTRIPLPLSLPWRCSPRRCYRRHCCGVASVGVPHRSGEKQFQHPVAYYSRKLKDPECNYDIHDKELLAIVDALQKWDTYCKTTGPKITILTDHKNLEYWNTKKDLNLRQAQWGERLPNYDFVIKYRPGKLAGKPDILSRE